MATSVGVVCVYVDVGVGGVRSEDEERGDAA
jgi:hypothetical protein